MDRSWGHWEVLKKKPNQKLKLLTVKPHSSLSMQRHQYRSERWYVVEGEGYVQLYRRKLRLSPGDTVDIESNRWHQLVNDTDNYLVVFEVQEGKKCIEEDIERKDEGIES